MTKKHTFAFLFLLWAGQAAAAEEPAFTETPQQRDERMHWWREARFGMFIHWGLYAVPAGEWNGRKIGGIGEWIMDNAKIPVPEYEKLVPQFNPVKFDARRWAQIAKNAGQKYMVITSKHHDGFCMFDTKVGTYSIMSTPFKRDVLKGLADACRDEGIRFCFYHSIMDWHHPDQNRDFPKYREYLFGQVRELLTNYGPIGVMWFDGEWIGQWDAKQGHELNALCHKLQPRIIVNNRVGKRQRDDGDFGTPEQEIPATGMPGYDWESCMTMNDTWGFKKDDHSWKSTETIIRMLVDCASKGGNLLLNVGPTAEGEIPQPSVERLAAVGQWLKANGDSVYGTTASPFRRLAWGRCTAKPGKLFLHVFSWPNGPLQLPGLDNPVRKAYLLGDEKRSELKLTKTDASLSIALPAEPPDKTDTVIVLEVEGEPRPAAFFLKQAADGTVALKAPDATLHGGTIQCEAGDKDCIGFWTRQDDWVSWDFELAKAGTFTVEVTLACEKGIGGSEYELAIGDQKLAGKVAETGAWSKFVTEKLGTVKLDKPGKHTLSVKAKTKPGMAVMNLRSVVLKPETGM